MANYMKSPAKIRIGIDLGGTKIELQAFNEQRECIWRRRTATPRQNYKAVIETITSLVHDCEKSLGSTATVGVGTPGAESVFTGLIKNANSNALIGQALRTDLCSSLEREVRIANDANCFALSEAMDGGGAGALTVFGVILGTGVGGGLVVNGVMLGGINAVAGELGHVPMPWPKAAEWPGRRCYCGHYGCIETFLSGPALSYDHQMHSGILLNSKDIYQQAVRGCVEANATLQRYEERLARALASVINLIDPEVIVVGGGLCHMDRIYVTVPELLKNHVFSGEVRTRIVKARHGDASGARGAAWLWAS